MRFGQNFHTYTIPEWEDLYIDYNRLKQLIKAPVTDDDAPTGASQVEQAVIDALSRLNSSEMGMYLSLIQHHDSILSSLAIQPALAPGAGSLWCTLDSDVHHYTYTQAAISELKSNLQRLQWFEHVNHEAVGRLFAKLRKHRSHRGVDPDALSSKWRQMQNVVDGTRSKAKRLIRDAIDSCRAPGDTSSSHSIVSPQEHPSHDQDFTLVEAIAHDSPTILKDYLDRTQGLQPEFFQFLFKRLALRQGWQCLMMLASRLAASLDHRSLAVLFFSLRAPLYQPSPASSSESLLCNLESVFRVVRELIANENEAATRLLCRADGMGQSPLHYAMRSGFDIFTAVYSTVDEERYHALLFDAMLSTDKQGLTPLHFAAVEGHTSVFITFFENISANMRRNKSQQVNEVVAGCLNIAIRLGNDILVAKLSSWAHTEYIPPRGQSAFHLAARAGRCDYMTVLINACALDDLNLDIADSCGRTPLMDAAMRGHTSVVELLLKAGANPLLIDNSAWTAQKYAVHRGHLTVAALLPKPPNPSARQLIESKATSTVDTSPSVSLAIAGCRPSKSALVIYLGSMQLSNNRSPVQLVGKSDAVPLSPSVPDLHRLELSVNQTDKQSQTIDLPFLEDHSSKPLIFELDTGAEPQLLIRLFKDDIVDGSCSSPYAAGAVFLRGVMAMHGHQSESLIRENTIILLSLDSQETIGTVLLTYMIARPFGHPQDRMPTSNPVSHESGQMTLVAHRGFGQNSLDTSHLQIGENTIGSFIVAADHGATFVEFDAQVSRDLQTVIYHDFSLSETGTDIPIHDVTIDQYKYASSVQTPYGSPLVSPDEQTVIGRSTAVRRSRSFDGQKDLGTLLIRDRLKHTVDFKSKGMKPNTRGTVIQEPLVTLPELFQRLPPGLGFNIEIKYPRLHEAVDAGIAPIALEINLFVDTVLEQICQFADQRPIILSSFTPEICILLSIKQKTYPVLFISNAGKLPANDLERRVASVEAGVHFAKTWGLAGLCLASEPLMLCPELISDIKRSGLLCASYGPQNGVPDNVLIQRDAGLDMIMVDKVALIANTLKQQN